MTMTNQVSDLDNQLQQRREENTQVWAQLEQSHSRLTAKEQELAQVHAALEQGVQIRDELNTLLNLTSRELVAARIEVASQNYQHDTTTSSPPAEGERHSRQQIEHELESVRAKLHDYFVERGDLSRRLQDANASLSYSNEAMGWLSEVSAVTMDLPIWWQIMPKKWRREKLSGRLRRKGLFDSQAYLDRYPDVSAASMDPLRHYLMHGINEGRQR